MVYLLHSAHRPDYNRQSSDLYGENKLHGEIMICTPPPHPPPSSPPPSSFVGVCLDEGETPTNKHGVYQWTISPGARAGPALAHVVKRQALRESARWWRDEDGKRRRRRRGEEDIEGGEGVEGGVWRVPDTRVPVFGYWACPSSFTYSIQREKMKREER